MLFALASKIPPEASTSTNGPATDVESDSGSKLPILQTAKVLAVSFAICKTATCLTKLFGIQGGDLPGITALVVVLATVLPRHFGYIAPACDAIAVILMQVCFVQAAVHLAVVLCFGKLFQFDLKLLLLASNANIGGPTTACGMATAKGWDSLVVPGILVGIFEISIATFLGIGFGTFVFKSMK